MVLVEQYFMNIEDLLCYIVVNWMKVSITRKIEDSYGAGEAEGNEDGL